MLPPTQLHSILHTWLVDKFTITPRLAITSPTKGCGKTTILRFLDQVVRRPKRAGSISLAALFRVIEQLHPTVILDETEKYIEHGSELHEGCGGCGGATSCAACASAGGPDGM